MTTTATQPIPQTRSPLLTGRTAVFAALLSLLYFADIGLRASRKLFWLDELFTVYLCRLPHFRDTWTAILHGADFNPPLFYVATRVSQHLFGTGLVATRLPEMVGFWVFCASLFVFVARRTGPLGGAVAALFPFFTLAQYYSYEARPHAITLGWCGLVLVCWQSAGEGEPHRKWWLAALALALTGGLSTHIYGVYLIFPLAVEALLQVVRKRRVDWPMAVTLLVPLAIAASEYVPLVRAFRATMPANFAHADRWDIAPFFTNVFGPAAGVLLFAIGAAAVSRKWRPVESSTSANLIHTIIPGREVLIAALFASLPLVGWMGARLSRGPFLDRYYLSSIAGYAILLAFLVSAHRAPRLALKLTAGLLIFLLVEDFAVALYLAAAQKDLRLVEPVGGFPFPASPRDPLERNASIKPLEGKLDVLVLGGLTYMYFYEYGPAALRPHLYFGAKESDDLFLNAYQRLAGYGGVPVKATAFAPFFATHAHFLAYARVKNDWSLECRECMGEILAAGYKLTSAKSDTDGTLYEYAR